MFCLYYPTIRSWLFISLTFTVKLPVYNVGRDFQMLKCPLWRQKKNRKRLFPSSANLFFFFKYANKDEIAPQCRRTTQNIQQTDDVYPFTSCYVYARLSLRDDAAGQKHLMRGPCWHKATIHAPSWIICSLQGKATVSWHSRRPRPRLHYSPTLL